MVSRESLRGYVLEEVLGRLLRDAGYALITSPDADTDGLRRKGNGLVVRGHGGDHQADALGLFTTVVPFALPVRLFLEAKHRGTKTGLPDVRNAFAVLHDVNQYVSASGRRRFDHHYALFSTGGFSRDAQRFANAHGITLQEFTGKAWTLLRESVEEAADAIGAVMGAAGASVPLWWSRQLLRAALDTPAGVSPVAAGDESSVDQRVRAAAATRQRRGSVSEEQVAGLVAAIDPLVRQMDRSLLIALADGRMWLALRPDHTADVTALLQHAEQGFREVRVTFGFDPVPSGADRGGDWVFAPDQQGPAFHLRVGIPEEAETGLLVLARPDAPTDQRSGRLTLLIGGQQVTLVYDRVEPPGLDPAGQRRTLRQAYTRPELAITPKALQPERQTSGAVSPLSEVPRAQAGEVVTGPAPALTSDGTTSINGASVELADDVTDEGRGAVPDEPDGALDEGPAPPQPGEGSGWPADEVAKVIAMLEVRSEHQASAVRSLAVARAAAEAGGRLSRDRVYEASETLEGNRFNGHGAAISRVVSRLVQDAEVPADRARPLVTRRGLGLTGRRALGVELRMEFVEALRG